MVYKIADPPKRIILINIPPYEHPLGMKLGNLGWLLSVNDLRDSKELASSDVKTLQITIQRDDGSELILSDHDEYEIINPVDAVTGEIQYFLDNGNYVPECLHDYFIVFLNRYFPEFEIRTNLGYEEIFESLDLFLDGNKFSKKIFTLNYSHTEYIEPQWKHVLEKMFKIQLERYRHSPEIRRGLTTF